LQPITIPEDPAEKDKFIVECLQMLHDDRRKIVAMARREELLQEEITKLWSKISTIDDNIDEMRTGISKRRVVNLKPTGCGGGVAKRPLEDAGANKSAAKTKKIKKN
jgi:hypothetical protein